MQHNSRNGRVRLAIVVSLIGIGLVPTASVAWTPTTPQISVAVFGGPDNDNPTSVAVDGSGNTYTTGYFSSTVDFDPGPGTTNLTAAASSFDVYISKLDASGNLVWARTFGDVDTDVGRSVTVDSSGNTYTTGNFSGTVDFDPGPGTTNLTAAGTDVFLLKLDTSGNLVWARAFGGTASDSGFSVTVDGTGNTYTTGTFNGTADFDPGPGNTNLTSAGGTDAFLSKIDASGNLVWARAFGGNVDENSYSVAVDGTGNTYTTGTFNGTADFDPGPGNTNLTSAGGTDIFISKLNTSGNLVWARAFGGTSSDVGRSAEVDGSGNTYTTGNFSGTVDFDPGSGTTNLTSAGSNDVFVSKLDASGNLAWARAFGGTSSDVGRSVTVDGSGNTFVAGQFEGTADFDPGAGVTSQTSAGGWDVFVSKLNPSGNLAWARTIGGTSSQIAVSVAVDGSGNTYTTGYFNGVTDFDPGAGTANLTSSSGNDIFVLKLDALGSATNTDSTPPSATWSSPSSPSSSRTLSYTLTFSEAVSGITSGDFRVLGTATGCVVTPSAASTQTSITVTVTCTADGTVLLELLQNSIVDGNSNTGPSANESATQITVISSAPTTPTTATTPTTVSATTTTISSAPTTTTNATASTTTSPAAIAPTTTTSSTATTAVAVTGQDKNKVTTNTPRTESADSGVAGDTIAPAPTSQMTSTSAPQSALPEIKVPDTEVGGASALIGGVEVEARVARENNELRVSAGSIFARIWATAKSGGKVPLDAEGRLRLKIGDSVTVDVEGLDAATPVEVRLYSDPVLLGRTKVDASGTLSAAYEIPESVTHGDHTVVMIGTSNGDKVTLGLSIAIGSGSTGINLWLIAVPIGLAMLTAILLPVALRRRKRDSST